jgi:putative transposase
MFPMLLSFLRSFRVYFQSRADLQTEILALRHQIVVLHRQNPKPRLKQADRRFWVALSQCWSRWRSALWIVKPATVIDWHRRGFRWYWTCKVRPGQRGRPRVSKETRELIRTLSRDNVGWGAPRIHGELLKLGIRISESSISKYMVRRPKPPSQTWRAFLENHSKQLVSIDFFTVPTALFRVLYVFIVIQHDRRHLVHFNVTEHPTSEWTARQIVEAFPFDSAPKYLLRDRDGVYGEAFRQQIAVMNIQEVLSAPRSPWQRAYVERVIGSIRRECLDHVVVLNEEGLRRLLTSYIRYYHRSRCICPWTKTRRIRERCSRSARLSLFLKSAACITDTSGAQPNRTCPRVGYGSKPTSTRIRCESPAQVAGADNP